MEKRTVIQNSLALYYDRPPHCPGCGDIISVDNVEGGGTFIRFFLEGVSSITGYFLCGSCNVPGCEEIDNMTIRNNLDRFVITVHDGALLEI